MERRPTAIRVLRTLASGVVLSPERISSITDIANQTVRNILVHLTSLSYVDRIEYGKYKITDFGLEQAKDLSQASTDQSSRRET